MVIILYIDRRGRGTQHEAELKLFYAKEGTRSSANILACLQLPALIKKLIIMFKAT